MPFIPSATAEPAAAPALAPPAPAPAPSPVPEPAAAPPPPSQSAQWAALTRKEAAAVAKLQEASAERAAAAADRAAAETARKESLDWAASFRKDPVGTLAKSGMTYSQLSEIVLNDGKIPVEQQLQEVRQELTSWQQQQKEALAQAEQAAADKLLADQQAAVTNAENGLRQRIAEVTANIEEYPLINQFKSQELVFATIDRHFNETRDPVTGIGKIMPEAEAAKLVESHHRKQVEEAYARIAPKAPNPPPTANRFTSRPTVPALTNRVASPSTSSVRPPNTVDEGIKRARAKYGF